MIRIIAYANCAAFDLVPMLYTYHLNVVYSFNEISLLCGLKCIKNSLTWTQYSRFYVCACSDDLIVIPIYADKAVFNFKAHI